GRDGRERPAPAPEAQHAAADFAETAPLTALPDLDLSLDTPATAAPAAAPEGEERPRRSRDRYGRDRRERGER
ncbi:hypothetical protein, partial [Acidovorax sp. SRB_24]